MHTSNTHPFAVNSRARVRLRLAATTEIADAYDYVGEDYGRYADGDGTDEDPSTSCVRSAHADSVVWQAICTTIDQLQAAGVSTIRLLDAGCGPGTWTRRIAAHAHWLGLKVDATGFDISNCQLAIARERTAKFFASRPGDSTFKFLEKDLTQPLPWASRQFHLVLCNFAVLNHLPSAALPSVVSELCRVASFRVISTARALASPPTACIAAPDQVREYHQDSDAGELAVVLKDGTEHRFAFNIYSAEALKAVFAPFAEVVDIRAVDLFVNRFCPDTNWTADLIRTLPGRNDVLAQLREIEDTLCRLPGWVDHGTHVLIVAEPRDR